jgi:hypothetical protein
LGPCLGGRREEILAAAFQEASYRARSPAEVEARTLRALERRAAAWRREQDEAAAEAEEADGESER